MKSEIDDFYYTDCEFPATIDIVTDIHINSIHSVYLFVVIRKVYIFGNSDSFDFFQDHFIVSLWKSWLRVSYSRPKLLTWDSDVLKQSKITTISFNDMVSSDEIWSIFRKF